MYGLMSIFGNGVISGWLVTAEESFSVGIGEGYGNINFMAGRTTFPSSITDIPPNSINYVFARSHDRTTFSESVEFILSPTKNLTDPHFLLLAEITAGPVSIINVDNSVRQEIQFLETIKAAIRLHKHRGGSLNPSKIDLTSEVKGQLPSFRIADFDAEKITLGTFDLERMPLIDHQDLANVGRLTHDQLDTFVKTLEISNKELFGEIGTANFLQMLIAMKLIHDDPESSFYIPDRTVDQNMINEIAVIPGITPNKFIDFENSTATIDLEQHFIKGIPPQTGTSFYVRYDSALAWNSAYSSQNLIVSGDTVTLAFNDDLESNIVTIEGFESATTPGQSLAGGSGGLDVFKKETIIISDNADIKASSSATNVIEGFYSGQFTHRQKFRNQFVKEFSTEQDWSTYDSLVVNVKCLDSIHGAVKMYLEDADGDRSASYTILDQDEVTDNADPDKNNFEVRVISLSGVSFRSAVKKLVFYTDDLENPFSFFVDYINIQRAILLPEEGQLKIRYSSGTSITFSMIEWTSIEPPGTEIKVRVRSANGTVFLTRSDYTPFLSNSSAINLQGTDLEIEVTFLPDSDRLLAPVLSEIKILILTEAEIDGFVIDEGDEFSRGTSENVDINTSPVYVSLDTPIYVDSYYFALGNSINQIHEETNAQGLKFANGELAIFGSSTPVAPNQMFKTIESGGTRVTNATLFEPRSVIRKNKRTFVVADTYNDRILEFNEDGDLLAGVGSVNYEHDTKTFPFGACVDLRTGILYIVWSRIVPFKSVNMSKITIQTAGQQVQLTRDFDKILGLTTEELETVNAEGQIMPVYLSAQNFGLIQNFEVNSAFVFVSSDAMTTAIDLDSVFYRSVSTALGIPMFVGNFAYIDGIFSPTSADKTEDDSFIVSNATVAIKDFEFPANITEKITKRGNVSQIIEIDKNNNVIFGSNVIKFSPFVPGRVKSFNTNFFLIGGLIPNGEEAEPTEGNVFDFRSINGDSDQKLKQRLVLQDIFFGGPKKFTGAVVVIDKRTNAMTFQYVTAEGMVVSDVDIDPNSGEYVVAESSFQKSGRIIKLDSVGNITFSYGEGLFSVINSVRCQSDSSMVIST